MNHRSRIILVSLGLAAATVLPAQGWDAGREASGWAFQEVDGSLMFFDPPARLLRTWSKGSGLLASQPLVLPTTRKAAPPVKVALARAPRGTTDYDSAGALLYGTSSQARPLGAVPRSAPQKPAEAPAQEAGPERWVRDAYERTWVVSEGGLHILGKDGRPGTRFPLPGPVEDMAVGRDGVFLLYRTVKPCLEKRDIRTGALLWSFGDKAHLIEAASQPLLVPLNRMALGADDTVYIAEGASLAFTILDPVKGPKEPGQTFFTCQDAIPARAVLGRVGRGPLLAWAGRDVLFGAFTPSQVKSCGAPESKGLLLARFDLAKGSLEWLPTPLAEGHRLVGLLDAEAVFVAPGGGLAYAPIR